MKNVKGALVIVLNIPWTFLGLCAALLSVPQRMSWSKNPPAIIFHITSFWWYQYFPGKKGIRAMTNGNVVQLGRWADESDKAHELIHVEQYMRAPFIHPILYTIESLRHGGGMQNRYEKEAYEKSGSSYQI